MKSKVFKVFVILAMTSIASCADLKCVYILRTSALDNGYNCQVADRNLVVAFKNTAVDRVLGRHLRFNNDNSVERLFFSGNPRMKFIPIGYSKFFPKLTNLWVENSPIESIYKSDFELPEQLTIVGILSSNIATIDEEVFSALVNLVHLNLNNNKIKRIHENSFSSLKKLTALSVASNKLGYLQTNIFVNNVNLEEINLGDNAVTIIESDVFKSLKKVRKIDLQRNVCIDRVQVENDWSKITFQQKIDKDCKNPMAETVEDLTKLKEKNEEKIKTLEEDKKKSEGIITTKDNLIRSASAAIVELKSENHVWGLQEKELRKELEILSMNHTEALEEMEKILNKTIELELNIEELNMKLNESSTTIEDLTAEITKLNDTVDSLETHSMMISSENEFLLDRLKDVVGNLTEANVDRINYEYENIELHNNLTNISSEAEKLREDYLKLQANLTAVLSENVNLELKIAELNGGLEGSTTNRVLQDDPLNINYRDVAFFALLVLFVLIALIFTLVRVTSRKKVRKYNTKEMAVAFSHESDDY